MRGLRSKYSPFSWSKRTIKIVMTVFYMIAVPVFIFVGLQPAGAVDAEGLPKLLVPSIELSTPVTESTVTNGELSVPDRIAAVYSMDPSKILLMGHSATVFSNLKEIKIGDEVIYNERTYTVFSIEQKLKENIKMADILAPAERETIVMMTCAGQPLGGNDFSHRLIITAE